MKKFMSRWQEIKIVEIEKETANSVWINGRSHRKITDFESFHDSFQDAKNLLLGRAAEAVCKAQAVLQQAEEKFKEIENLKE